MSFKLDLAIGNRYSSVATAELNLTRKYEQFSEKTWIEQPGKNGMARFKPFGGLKPSGLWYSFGRLWIDFNPMFKKGGKTIEDKGLPPTLQLTIDTSSFFKICTIPTIIAFNEAFKSNRGKGHIDWRRVARKYDGVEITQYDKSKSNLPWYQSFDVSSGCIWNLQTIKHVQRSTLRYESPQIFCSPH